jgi:tetratricopeptide (TPR) repeat protein
MWTTGQASRETATALNNMAELYRAQGDFRKAEAYARRSVVLAKTVDGPDGIFPANSLQTLASVLSGTGRNVEAATILEDVLRRRETAGEGDSASMAVTLNNLAATYLAMRRPDKAEAPARRGVALSEARLGLRHPTTAAALNNLAQALRFTQRRAEAEPLYRRAVAIWENALGPNHPDVAKAVYNLECFRRDRDGGAGVTLAALPK